MAELKTKAHDGDVDAFLDGIADERRRDDCRALARILAQATRARPKMWGAGIVGFGEYHYVYASGREGDWFLAGFSPRKPAITLYLSCDIERHAALLAKLGRHKTGKGCLYIKSLADVDVDVLKQLVAETVAVLKSKG